MLLPCCKRGGFAAAKLHPLVHRCQPFVPACGGWKARKKKVTSAAIIDTQMVKKAQAQLERVEEVGRCEDDGEDGEHGEPAEVEEEDRGGTSAATRRALWANVVPEAGDEADAAGLAPPPVEERDL
jgi:hypothetical protein